MIILTCDRGITMNVGMRSHSPTNYFLYGSSVTMLEPKSSGHAMALMRWSIAIEIWNGQPHLWMMKFIIRPKNKQS